MLKAEYRRATAELTKKVQRKESVISKRKSREEKAAEMHKKGEDKENNKQRSEIKDNNRLTVRKDLFGQTTVDKQHESKQTKEGNKLELIWHKRDITRMRDSEISLQMANMRRYAETESRGIVHGKTKLGCEELERLKDIDMQRELTQMTYFRAKADRDISQSDAVDRKVTIDFSSEVDDLAQISTEMKKLKISEWSLNTSLRVGSKFSHETTEQQKLSHTEAELDNCQAEEQAPVGGHVKDLKSRKNKKEVFEPRDSLEHIGLVKKRRNTLKSFHAQRKKLKRVCENEVDVKEIETKQRNYSKKLHTSLSKLCDENRVCEKRSVHSYSSARSIQPCTNLPSKSKTKAKLNARVKVPKSTCKHYRNRNVPPRRRKAWRKYRANSSLCHELSAQNSLELLRQRQKSNKRLLVQTATSSCAKFNESLNSRALPKSEFSSCTAVSKTSLNHMADDVPSTSKATVKSRAVVQDFKSTYSTSDNETRCEPSTSSLEEMLVHIKTQLKLRHNKKHGSSDKTTNSCMQKIRLQQQNAKVAGKSSKAKGRSASRKQINKPRKRHKHRPLVDSIRIPLVRNNAFILGQQNRCIEIAYATGSHSLNIKSVENITPPATQPNSRRRRKLKKKPSNGVQESEA
uniref:Uncharacterized protein n=1 Tax=Bactrocera dorsalis TaxID=27457 RepID=A0A034V6P0_BACDO